MPLLCRPCAPLPALNGYNDLTNGAGMLATNVSDFNHLGIADLQTLCGTRFRRAASGPRGTRKAMPGSSGLFPGFDLHDEPVEWHQTVRVGFCR